MNRSFRSVSPSENDAREAGALEPDAVWKLLEKAPPADASPHFADRVMRAVKSDEPSAPWWKRWVLPASLAGLAATAAAVVLSLPVFLPAPPSSSQVIAVLPAQDSFEAVQDITDSEVLVAAADHLDRYSDTELVSLISF